MAQVLAQFQVAHPHEAIAAAKLGLYVGLDGMAQSGLSASDVEWLRSLPRELLLSFVDDEQARRASWRTLWGHESDAMTFVAALMAIVFVLLVARLTCTCKSHSE